MAGEQVRDKDAEFAARMLCELGAFCKHSGITILDYLDNIYKKYGYSFENTLNLYMEGADGFFKMQNLMKSLRNAPPSSLGGKAIRYFNDFKTGKSLDLEKKYVETLDKHGSDVILFILPDGTKVIIRPSGTAPKIKVYFLLRGQDLSSLKELCAVLEKDMLSLIPQYSEV